MIKNIKKIVLACFITIFCLSNSMSALAAERSITDYNLKTVSTNSNIAKNTVVSTSNGFFDTRSDWYSASGNAYYDTVTYTKVLGTTSRRVNLTVKVENFNASDRIRVLVDKSNGTRVFDSYNTSVGSLSTGGYYEIKVSLPASSYYTMKFEITSSSTPISSGRINVWTY